MSPPPVPLPVRVYAALLRLLPRRVRDADGVEMLETFAALWRDAVRERRRTIVAARSFGRLPLVAAAEWLDRWSSGSAVPDARQEDGMVEPAVRLVRQATRSLGRSPAFLWTVILLLGLGVGGVTTIFTLVDHVILRPLPYPAADRLFELRNGDHSGLVWRYIQDVSAVDVWGAAQIGTANRTGDGRPERLHTASVSEDFFALFGATPEIGRLLVPDDFRTLDGVVISAGLWRRTYGGSQDALGRTIVLDGQPRVVVGVMASSFVPPEALTGATVDVWLPMDWDDPAFGDAGYSLLAIVGKLAAGASLAAAQSELDLVVRRLAQTAPDRWRSGDGESRTLPALALHEATVGSEVRQGLGLLLGAVTLLLLVACTNVAHLFLARGLARIREMAVRRALGAGRRVIAGQLFVESLMVGLAGAAVGVALAYTGVAAFLALGPDAIPRASAVHVDMRVLGFAVAIGTFTALAFGLLPALRLVGSDTADALHRHARGSSDSRRDRRMRGALVVAEVALSLVLLVQAGALLRGFARLNATELGFRTDGVWTMPLRIHDIDEPRAWALRMDRIRDAVAAVPGVRAATYAMTLPLEFTGGGRCCWSSEPVFSGSDKEGVRTNMHLVDAEYFSTLDLRLVAGRAWTQADARAEPGPAVVTEPLAIRVFGSVDRALRREMIASVYEGAARFRIVGVVADNRHYGPDQDHGPAAYMPARTLAFPLDRGHLAVLVDRPTEDLAARLREAIWSVEPELPVPTVRPLAEWAGEATARARFETILFTTFAVVALLLVSAGLYGTLLYAVGRRRRELGIRLALGDAPRRLERRVIGQGVATAALGCAFGVFGAWTLRRFLASRVSDMPTGDPLLIAAAVALLFAVALGASWLPARRAARTDPLEALRSE